MAKNLKEHLIKRKIKRANPLLGLICIGILRRTAKKRNVTYEYLGNVKKYRKQQIILLSTHCARDEYVYVLPGYYNMRMHCVSGFHNFFEKPLYGLLTKLGGISKFLYQPDPTATKQMLRVIKNGDSLVLFPEGIQSTTGSTHPINPATMRFLEKCRLPVVLCTSKGTYLTSPRYASDKRIGKVTVTYQVLFTAEDYDKYTQEELYQKLLEKFCYNDMQYNAEAKIPFVGKGSNIDGLDRIIFKCPHCNSEFSLSTHNDSISCSQCGYSVSMDSCYQLHQENLPIVFDDIDKWYKWQRKQVAQQVISPQFEMSMPVKAYDINAYKLKKTRDLVGEGVATIDRQKLVYRGSYYGQQTELVFELKNLPSAFMAQKVARLDFYYGNNYYAFEPQENPLQVTKWVLAIEEAHNLYDPRWADASKKVYD